MFSKKEQALLDEMMASSDNKGKEAIKQRITQVEENSREKKKKEEMERKRKKQLYMSGIIECGYCGERVTRRNLGRHHSSISCRVGKENKELKIKEKEWIELFEAQEKEIKRLNLKLKE